MRLFDSHCHLEDSMIEDIKASEVARVCNIACDYQSSCASVALTKKYDFVYGTVGVHPEFAQTVDNVEEAMGEAQSGIYGGFCGDLSVMADLRDFAGNNDKIVAIGEIGLDYYWDTNPDKEVQKLAFIQQIELAKELKMPICIHSREADQDTMDILKACDAFSNIRVLMHCFSGSAELAKQYVKLGAWISLAGPLTYKNNKKTVEVAKEIPLERLLVETDSPYLTPEPLRGKPNCPVNVKYTAMKLAEIKGLTLDAVAEQTFLNACDFYGIDA